MYRWISYGLNNFRYTRVFIIQLMIRIMCARQFDETLAKLSKECLIAYNENFYQALLQLLGTCDARSYCIAQMLLLALCKLLFESKVSMSFLTAHKI